MDPEQEKYQHKLKQGGGTVIHYMLHSLLRLDRKIFDVLTENISGDAVEGPGVLAPPHNPDGPGELGKPVKIENPEPDVKKKIDQGWQDNAFNQVCMQGWLLVVPLNLT